MLFQVAILFQSCPPAHHDLFREESTILKLQMGRHLKARAPTTACKETTSPSKNNKEQRDPAVAAAYANETLMGAKF